MIAAFGKFAGGELNYWSEDNKSRKLDELPIKPTEKFQLGVGLALFNGNSAHSVNHFEGQRFSVVYFTNGSHASLDPEDVSILKELGMPYPATDIDEFKLLRRPQGYTAQGLPVAAKNNESKLPAACYWTRDELEKKSFRENRWTPKALQEWEDKCTKLTQKSFVLRRPNVAEVGMDKE